MQRILYLGRNLSRAGFPARLLSSGVRITQKLGSTNLKDKTYECHGINTPLKHSEQTDKTWPSYSKSLYSDIVSNFVPKGYPYSVSSGYGRYATGHFISSIFSSAGGVLSIQALLHGVGLGAGAIPLAAALNWVIKDGLGQLGGVIFASLVNNKFDADPKKWRLIAAVSMEISSLLEFMTPLCPQYFLPIASVANVGKNISFLAASASRAAIHNSFAVNENLADVTGKAGSQSILASTIGTGLGIGIASVLGHHFESSLIAFGLCSSFGLLSLQWSLRGVVLHALSPDKLMFVYGTYRHHAMNCKDISEISLLTPKQVTEVEANSLAFNLDVNSIMLNISRSPNYTSFTSAQQFNGDPIGTVCPTTIGSAISKVFPDTYTDVLPHMALFEDRGYIIKMDFTSGNTPNEIHIIFRQGAGVADIVEAYAHVFEINLLLLAGHMDGTDCIDGGGSLDYRLNKLYIDAGRRALDRPVNLWSPPDISNIPPSDKNNTESPHELNESTFQYFLTQISNTSSTSFNSMSDGAVRCKNEEGFVSGGSVGWHLNPLLLEPRYARILCTKTHIN